MGCNNTVIESQHMLREFVTGIHITMYFAHSASYSMCCVSKLVMTDITFLLSTVQLLLLALVCVLVCLNSSLHFLSNFAAVAYFLMVAVNNGLLLHNILLHIIKLHSCFFMFQLLLLDFCFLQE